MSDLTPPSGFDEPLPLESYLDHLYTQPAEDTPTIQSPDLDIVPGHCTEGGPDDLECGNAELEDGQGLHEELLLLERCGEPEPLSAAKADDVISDEVKAFYGFDKPLKLVLPPLEPKSTALEGPSLILAEVPLADVMTATLEQVRFALKPWLPRRHVTLFGGHGGVGKSSLALAMGAHVAAGLPFAGHEVDRLPVLFVSLEDEPSIVRLRLRRIIETYSLDAGEVLPRMTLLDGTQAFSALMTEGDGFNAPPQFTQAFRELAEQAQGAGLVIIDNASDAFDANENSRRAVRAFVRGLAAIARKHDAAVVLLAHIDKSAAKDGARGNSYSGSTAWHNSARSRLALTEQDGAIILAHEKANLSRLAEPLRLAFADGVIMPEAGTGSAAITSEHFDQAEIIRALRAATEAGINVPASLTPGAYSAMKALEPLPEYGQTFKGKAGSKRAAAALTALQRDGRISNEDYRTPQRKTKTRLVIVEGLAQNDDQGTSDKG